jgi:hypothetical protein
MGVGDHELDATAPRGRAGPVVRFGAIGEAWGLVLAQWSTWVVATIVVILANGALGALAFALFGAGHAPMPRGFRFGFPEGATAVQVVLHAIVNGVFVGGMLRMACRQIRGQSFGVEDLFSVTDVLGELVLGSALFAAALFVAGLFCFVPALVAFGLLMFTLPLIVDGRLKATDAIAQSFRTLKGEWLAASAFHLVVTFLSGVGSCFCFVGLVLTAPLYVLSIALLYRDAFLSKGIGFGAKPAPPDAEFWLEPPSP